MYTILQKIFLFIIITEMLKHNDVVWNYPILILGKGPDEFSNYVLIHKHYVWIGLVLFPLLAVSFVVFWASSSVQCLIPAKVHITGREKELKLTPPLPPAWRVWGSWCLFQLKVLHMACWPLRFCCLRDTNPEINNLPSAPPLPSTTSPSFTHFIFYFTSMFHHPQFGLQTLHSPLNFFFSVSSHISFIFSCPSSFFLHF